MHMKLYISNNGVDWKEAVKFQSTTIWDIKFVKDKFIGIGPYSIYTSIDGINWSKVNTNIELPYNINNIVYGNGKYILTSPYNGLYYSDNLINWTKANIGQTNTRLSTLAFGGGKFVAAGEKIFTSGDGVNWSDVSPNSYMSIGAAVYGNGKFVLTGNVNNIYTSNDGVTWKKSNYFSDTYSSVYNMVYSDGLYVILGEKNTFFTSIDGENWVRSNSIKYTGTLNYIINVKGNYLAYGNDADVMTGNLKPKINNIETIVLPNGISAYDDIVVNYSENMEYGTGFANIKLVHSNGTEIPVYKVIDGNKLIIKLKEPLYGNNKYVLNIPAGAVKDLFENAISEAMSFNINTDNAEIASADVNGDNKIDLLDLASVASNYNNKPSKSDWNSIFDIVRDYVIDVFDLVYISKLIK